MKPMNNTWWQRPGLDYRDNSLSLGGENLQRLVERTETPCYVYDRGRIADNLARLRQALTARAVRHRIFYAVKANRHPVLLAHLRHLNTVGIDCCSPGELELARRVGFQPAEISYTGAIAPRDLRILRHYPDIALNCDSLAQIRQIGELHPGRAIGIRVNPSFGLSYASLSAIQYSGQNTTKFGVYPEQFAEALALARQYHLKVVGIHCHIGWGILTPQLAQYRTLLEKLQTFIQQVPGIEYVNLGGGLGVPLAATDQALDLAAWSGLLAEYFAGQPYALYIEPGTYLVMDAGVLVVQVAQIERKQDTVFVYVDAGHNINVEPVFYQLPMEIVPLAAPPDSATQTVTVAGNINEALDIFARNIALPASLREGDYLALLNAGGYGAAMSSNHCARGQFEEYWVD